jgi:hypothetical protein
MLRTTSGGEGKTQQGTAHGVAKHMSHNFSSMIAGIDPKMSDANSTRFYPIDLEGRDGRRPPRDTILEKYTKKQIDDLREANTVDAYQDIALVLRSLNYVKDYALKHPEIFGGITLQRFKDNLIFHMAIIHACGDDFVSWCKDVCVVKAEKINIVTSKTGYDDLYNTLLLTPCVGGALVDGGLKRNPADFFGVAANHSEVSLLNHSGSGVSIHEDPIDGKWYLLVMWQEAIAGILSRTKMVRRYKDAQQFRVVMSRHPRAVPSERDKLICSRTPTIKEYVHDHVHTMIEITFDVQSSSNNVEKRKREALAASADNLKKL